MSLSLFNLCFHVLCGSSFSPSMLQKVLGTEFRSSGLAAISLAWVCLNAVLSTPGNSFLSIHIVTLVSFLGPWSLLQLLSSVLCRSAEAATDNS